MAQIYEVKTKNGRTFRVIAENKFQEKRLFSSRAMSEGTPEEVTSIECVLNGAQSTKSFLDMHKAYTERAKQKLNTEG